MRRPGAAAAVALAATVALAGPAGGERQPDLGVAAHSIGDIVVGDWNGDGIDTIGFRTGSRWELHNTVGGGPPDVAFGYGLATDVAVVGDWNGDGIDTIGVYRDREFLLRDSNTGGPANRRIVYGRIGDRPLTGDWNGDGIDTIGVYRDREFLLRDSNTGGPANRRIVYGRIGDRPLTGDWNGDGIDTIGVYRDREFLLRDSNTGGPANRRFVYGRIGDRPLTGDWNGDGIDTPGIYRDGDILTRNSNSGGAGNLVRARDHPTRRIVINGTGDVNFGPYSRLGVTVPYSAALTGLGGLFLQDDLTVVNLECAPTLLGGAVPKAFNFRCPPEGLPTLAAGGVDVANLANNHGLDYGLGALNDSIANVHAAGIAPVGAGANAGEAGTAAYFDIDGWTVAVLGFSQFVELPWQFAGPANAGLARGDRIAAMLQAIQEAGRRADTVIVTIHWGIERQPTPDARQVDLAHAMVDAGVDIVFGHHPHRLQPLEIYRGHPIFYSLGNFVWPRQVGPGSDTGVAQVVIEADGRIRACLLDATIVADGQVALDDPARRC